MLIAEGDDILMSIFILNQWFSNSNTFQNPAPRSSELLSGSFKDQVSTVQETLPVIQAQIDVQITEEPVHWKSLQDFTQSDVDRFAFDHLNTSSVGNQMKEN